MDAGILVGCAAYWWITLIIFFLHIFISLKRVLCMVLTFFYNIHELTSDNTMGGAWSLFWAHWVLLN